jgi:hypothetical protein
LDKSSRKINVNFKQGVALLRNQMSSKMEDLFSRKNTLEEIRVAARNNSQLE